MERRSLRADVPGRSVRLDGVGKFLVFDGLKPAHAVSLAFSVPQRTGRYTIKGNSDAEQVYACTFRGSTCVEVSPRDDAPMKSIERFVPERMIRDW